MRKDWFIFWTFFFERNDNKFFRNQQTFKILKKLKYDKYENRKIILRDKKIILFETDGKAADTICLRDEQKFG